MEKANLFEYLTKLLPGALLTFLLAHLLGLESYLDFATNPVISGLILLLFGFYMGELLSIGGAKLEEEIDKICKAEHPLIKIVEGTEKNADPDQPNADGKYTKLVKHFEQNVPVDGDNEMKRDVYNTLFYKAKSYVYSQGNSDRLINISTQATFYRNMVFLFLTTFLSLLVYSILKIFAILKHCNCYDMQYIKNDKDLTNIVTFCFLCLIMIFISRYLSQRLYKKWFKEVLMACEVILYLK